MSAVLNMKFPEYERQVIEWIAYWSRRNTSDLSGETCINCGFFGGLGVSGSDGYELLQFLAARSGVDFKEFEVDRYFGSELSVAALVFRPLQFIRAVSGPKLPIGILSKFMFDHARGE